MNALIVFISIAMIATGCGGRSKKSVAVVPTKNGETNQEVKLEQVSITPKGLTTADASQSWFIWSMSCGDDIAEGNVQASDSISFYINAEALKDDCTVRVTGDVPPDQKENYISLSGLLYVSLPQKLAVGLQSVELSKKYEGKSGDDSSNIDQDHLEVSTTDGGKCKEFDTETFECLN